MFIGFLVPVGGSVLYQRSRQESRNTILNRLCLFVLRFQEPLPSRSFGSMAAAAGVGRSVDHAGAEIQR